MKNNQSFYEDLVQHFQRVAKTKKDIRAAFIIGSRARKNHPADQWSDLDILLYTKQPEYYLETADFVAQFGTIWSSFATKTLGNDLERLTLFDGGYQVDLVVKTSQEYDEYVTSQKVPWLFKRGVKLIIDNAGNADTLLPKQAFQAEKTPLTEDTFSQVNQMFWFITMYIGRQLLREENWAVKTREMDFKNVLLQMIEWYEQTIHGQDYDTWHGGRFIKEWAEPDIYENLFQTFGAFDLVSNWSALKESIQLFSRLSAVIAEKNQFFMDKQLQENVEGWLMGKNPNW